MPYAIIPWEPCQVPSEIQEELSRRKTNRSFNYVAADQGGWNSSTGDWVKARGPMSPWVRFCSNGRGRVYRTDNKGNFVLDPNGNRILKDPSEIKEGFVLFSGKDFYSGYGFNNDKGSPSIIGYVPDKQHRTHTIDNDFDQNYPIHVPPPEIEKINVNIQKELYRRASIDWVCFSKKQLEYMTPYFLVPGISCILEWGWNHYNSDSLLDLSKKDILKKRFNNPYPLYTKNILQSRGNYDVIFGIVTHFEWSVEGNKIKCKTEITSKDRIYAGILTNSNITIDNEENKKGKESKENDKKEIPLNSLRTFVKDTLPKFREMTSEKDPSMIKGLENFINFVKDKHPVDWEDYIYGIFYGRDIKNSLLMTGRNEKDFDDVKNKELWINLGLAMEVINFHSDPLKAVDRKEMFRIDIDDVVISGHPNLISSDGTVCLVPNAAAPRYFYGLYGITGSKAPSEKEYYEKIGVATEPPIPFEGRDSQKNILNNFADHRLFTICSQPSAFIYRDNIDRVINDIRYTRGLLSSFEFPFKISPPVLPNSNGKPYPAKYSGYLKNLYVNVDLMKTILADESIKTYLQFVERILERINRACGNFWDFRVVESTGKEDLDENEIATMKVVDYKFMYFSNRGKVLTLDYYDADSLLQGMGFKPTISNPQAIRSIFAPTNNPNRNNTITNGQNELLDYHFDDRLFFEDQNKDTPNFKTKADTSGFVENMMQLQSIFPTTSPNSPYQITNIDTTSKITSTPTSPGILSNFFFNTQAEILYQNARSAKTGDYSGNQAEIVKQNNISNAAIKKGGVLRVRRLVLPNQDILQLLLDDSDEKNNPKYTGVMPGIQANFTIQGIGGLRTFMMFLVRNLPAPYSQYDIVFRITDVQHIIESGKWVTTITAGIIPLRGYIKDRLGITS